MSDDEFREVIRALIERRAPFSMVMSFFAAHNEYKKAQ